MRVYLTGFMGCGKSTVGRRLASRLDMPFVDTDDWIEKQIGMRIPEYFAEAGEAAFREQERNALEATAAHPHAVVATGGGMLVDEARMQRAKELGTVVYLQVDVDTLYKRLAPEAASRPLLWDDDGTPLQGTALRRHIADLLAWRAPAYERAHLQVDATDRPERVSATIAAHVQTQKEKPEEGQDADKDR
ncbi:MAG: shikimate kinase [Longimonas sp.]|uniref:shikimate kinase n=1 Tax=Longimonas sp. TaxID=2039626 RepID=UPI00335FA72B